MHLTSSVADPRAKHRSDRRHSMLTSVNSEKGSCWLAMKYRPSLTITMFCLYRVAYLAFLIPQMYSGSETALSPTNPYFCAVLSLESNEFETKSLSKCFIFPGRNLHINPPPWMCADPAYRAAILEDADPHDEEVMLSIVV